MEKKITEIIRKYAHDFRDQKIDVVELEKILRDLVDEILEAQTPF